MTLLVERPAPVDPAEKAKRRFSLPQDSGWRATSVVSCVLIALLVLTPIVYLLWQTFDNDGQWGFGGFVRAYVDAPNAGSMIRNSIEFSIGSAVLAFVIGTGLAFLQARTDAWLKALLFTISVVPMAVPPLLYATSWIFLASPTTGMFNSFTHSMFGARPFDIYSMWGMIWVQGTHLSPLAFLFMTSAMSNTDPSLEESAAVCGAGRLRVLRKVTGPLVLPAAAASLLLIFVQSLESFEVPGVLGLREQRYVFTTQLYTVLQGYPTDYQEAGAIGTGLLVVALLAFYISTTITRRRGAATVTGKAFRPNLIPLGRAKPVWALVVLAYFLLTVVIPVAMLVYSSFLPYYQSPSSQAFHAFTTSNYTTLFSNSAIIGAFERTLMLAAIGAVAVMTLTLISGWSVRRMGRRPAAVLDALTLTPLVVPGIVLGISLSFVFLRVPIPIYDTVWIMLLAFVVKFLPYGSRYVDSALSQVGKELHESAEVAGASLFTVLRRITLPIVKNGLLAGLLLVFVLAFREVSAVILLYSPGNELLSVIMWQQIQNGDFGALSALGTLMTAILAIAIFFGYRTTKNFGIQQQI